MPVVATVLLFHHAQGQTAGFLTFAGDLRAAGRTVHAPDLYDGRTFPDLREDVAHAEQVGFPEIIRRGSDAAKELPADNVYGCFSCFGPPVSLFRDEHRGTPSIGGYDMASALQPTRHAGGCQCGTVRYEISGEPLALYVCHCRECQKQSASAFGISVIVRRADFRLSRGEVKVWSRRTDSGGTLACAFCPHCGSRLWHESVATTETISVKGGSLDDPPDLRSAVHIWISRKLPGVIIPDAARQFPGEPD